MLQVLLLNLQKCQEIITVLLHSILIISIIYLFKFPYLSHVKLWVLQLPYNRGYTKSQVHTGKPQMKFVFINALRKRKSCQTQIHNEYMTYTYCRILVNYFTNKYLRLVAATEKTKQKMQPGDYQAMYSSLHIVCGREIIC